MNLAVIDLGTNTFHILVVKINKGQNFDLIYQERLFTKLGEEGLGTIGVIPYQRGLKAIAHFREIIGKYEVETTEVIGTSALREASNGSIFIQEVRTQFGLEIKLISGMEEGKLIQQGVQLAVGQIKNPYVIMDIGGGSVEFIVVYKGKCIFINSFLIGLSILHKLTDISDGCTAHQLTKLNDFLSKNLDDLIGQLKNYADLMLVGSAGAFEVLVSMLGKEFGKSSYCDVSISDFIKLYSNTIHASRKEKLTIPGIPQERLDYIGVAFHLIKFVISNADIQSIKVSKYALKEGIISNYLD